MDTYINLPKPMGRVDEGQWATTMVWRLSMTNSVGPNRYRFRHTRIDAYAHRDDITNTHMCCENEKPPSVFWISGVYAAVIFIVIDDWAAHPCRHPFLVHQRGWQVRVDRSYRRIIIYIYTYIIYTFTYVHVYIHMQIRIGWCEPGSKLSVISPCCRMTTPVASSIYPLKENPKSVWVNIPTCFILWPWHMWVNVVILICWLIIYIYIYIYILKNIPC